MEGLRWTMAGTRRWCFSCERWGEVWERGAGLRTTDIYFYLPRDSLRGNLFVCVGGGCWVGDSGLFCWVCLVPSGLVCQLFQRLEGVLHFSTGYS